MKTEKNMDLKSGTDSFITLNVDKEIADCNLNIRLTKSQKEVLMNNAAVAGMSITKFILTRTLFSEEVKNEKNISEEQVQKIISGHDNGSMCDNCPCGMCESIRKLMAGRRKNS